MGYTVEKKTSNRFVHPLKYYDISLKLIWKEVVTILYIAKNYLLVFHTKYWVLRISMTYKV